MDNQDGTSGWPLDMHQLKWALRHGQLMNGLEKVVLTSQPTTPIGNNRDNSMKNDSIAENISLHNAVLEDQIDRLEQSLNREIVSLKGEFAIVAQGTAVEEKIDELGQTLNQEILSLKSKLAIVAQDTTVEEQIDKLGQSLNQEILSLKSEFAIVAQSMAVEEQIDKLGQSLNQEILSLKSKLAIVAQDTTVEEQIDKLGQSFNQEILSLKSEFANVAQSMAVEEQIDKLGQSFNQEILSLKSEFANVAQSMAVEEQIDKLGQSFNQEILSLKSELAIVAQGTTVEEQIDKLGQTLNQEILSLRNEFAMFVQTQLNQEKAWKTAEVEWKNSLEDRATKLQADMRQMQHNILAKIEEHFQYVDEERQHNDNMLRQELSLLTLQLTELQQSQNNKGQVLTNDWQKKLEERQTQLSEDVSYIQYVVEEIATRPQSIEAQQKLREKFFMREIAVLKEELSSACKTWKSMKKGRMMANTEKEGNPLPQEEINFGSEAQTRVYEKKRKRGH